MSVKIFWELPLAVFSFCFYKVVKFIVGNLYTLYLGVNQQKSRQWRVLSAETLRTFLSLPVLMTKGPRWNTHAIIGTLGPFPVNQSLTIDIQAANQTTDSWIAVIYDFPNYRTITSIESHHTKGENLVSLPLQSGKYSVGLRYYNCDKEVILPSIKTDDVEWVSRENVPLNVNDFYKTLINYKNWFYLSLHYYIFVLLKYRNYLPPSLVRNEYLPVGATDTEFVYNYLTKGQKLQVLTDIKLIQAYDIYLTLYDWSSLPLTWTQITTTDNCTNPIPNNGYYLIRFRPKATSLEEALSQYPLKTSMSDLTGAVQKLTIECHR